MSRVVVGVRDVLEDAARVDAARVAPPPARGVAGVAVEEEDPRRPGMRVDVAVRADGRRQNRVVKAGEAARGRVARDRVPAVPAKGRTARRGGREIFVSEWGSSRTQRRRAARDVKRRRRRVRRLPQRRAVVDVVEPLRRAAVAGRLAHHVDVREEVEGDDVLLLDAVLEVQAVADDVETDVALDAHLVRAVDGHAAPEAPVERRVRHVGALAAVSEQVPVQRVAACARSRGTLVQVLAQLEWLALLHNLLEIQVLAQREWPARKKQQRRW